jgi:CDP-diglyceride synthetase
MPSSSTTSALSTLRQRKPLSLTAEGTGDVDDSAISPSRLSKPHVSNGNTTDLDGGDGDNFGNNGNPTLMETLGHSITTLPILNDDGSGHYATEYTHIPLNNSTGNVKENKTDGNDVKISTNGVNKFNHHHCTSSSASIPTTAKSASAVIPKTAEPSTKSLSPTDASQQPQQQQPQQDDDTSSRRHLTSMTGAQVAKDEKRKSKIMVRAISGAGLIAVFSSCVYLGHLYVCGIVAVSEFLLFRELVKVRYNAYFNTIQDTIPLFRTTQWMWFSVAIFYTYGDFVTEVIQSNPDMHYLMRYSQYVNTIAFSLYSATFVVTIATMQTGHIKFQLNQLCWTIVVLCLTVGQMKYIMHNIFNGLFWFTFPFLLVVVNDVMAYFSGITCGRKFIQRPFISFSPNKTWEGFIGGGIFTMIAAWYLSRLLAQFPWMTCPINEFRFIPDALECDNHHIFEQAQSVFPSQVFEVFPHGLVKMIPGIVEICSIKSSSSSSSSSSFPNIADPALSSSDVINNYYSTPQLTRCISGERSHVFHHFELVLKDVYPIQIHALCLGFFASVVAPFGGFLASAIKRAYGVKDFGAILPGHGGVTDRLDCQFMMALFVWVHYNTFVRMTTVSVSKLLYFFNMMSAEEKREFLEEILPPDKPTNRMLLKRFGEYSLAGRN